MGNLRQALVAGALSLPALALPAFGSSLVALEAPFPQASPVGAAARNHPVDCGSTPQPVVALHTVSKYRQDDPTKSTIDAEAQSEFEKSMKPIHDLTQRVTKFANAYRVASAKSEASAACALGDLETWASAHALGEIENDKAYDTQGKTIAALALGYLQLRGARLDEDRRRRIVAWLASMAADLRHFVDASKGKSSKNNHRYWSGLGVAAAGVAADRRDLVDWGIESARIGLRQVQADGTLPLELERAERARDYHLYALAPLVMLAELSLPNGIDLYSAYDGALHKLAMRVMASLDDPSYFEKLTGERQSAYPGGQGVPSFRLAWLEPYNARFPSTQGAFLLQSKRPLVETGLGGNLTLVYAGASGFR